MNMRFLLGLSLLCLLGDGDPSLFPGWNMRRQIVCAVCQIYKKGVCMKGESTCTTTAKNGCRSRSYYSYSEDIYVWKFTFANLECAEDCRESLTLTNWTQVVNTCCRKNYCNKRIEFQ